MILIKVIESWKMKDKLNIFLRFFFISFLLLNKIVIKIVDEVLFDRIDYRWLAKFMQKNFNSKCYGRLHSLDHN